MLSRFIKHEVDSPNGVRVSIDGGYVVVRAEDADHAIPVHLTVEQAKELATVIKAAAIMASDQESEVMD